MKLIGIDYSKFVHKEPYKLDEAHKNNFLKGASITNSGCGNRSAKLSNKDIQKIKTLWSSGTYIQKEIALLFDVKQSTISRILSGKTWDHLQ